MRLVACQKCTRQLDLSNVDASSVMCRCGVQVENRAPDGLDLEVHRCSACAASVSSTDTHCEYCGSEIVRNRHNLSLICPACFARNADHDRFCSGCGLPFEPVSVDSCGEELLCPDCHMPVDPHLVGDVRISECPQCNGLWVPENRFDELMDRAVQAKRDTPRGELHSFSPRMKGGNPASQRVRYRECPVCKHHMHRKNFRKTSGVIIDRCNSHGTWLDADELERIAGYLMSGGRPAAERYMREEEHDSKQRRNGIHVDIRQTIRPVRPVPTRARGYDPASDSSTLGTLFRVFTEILD